MVSPVGSPSTVFPMVYMLCGTVSMEIISNGLTSKMICFLLYFPWALCQFRLLITCHNNMVLRCLVVYMHAIYYGVYITSYGLLSYLLFLCYVVWRIWSLCYFFRCLWHFRWFLSCVLWFTCYVLRFFASCFVVFPMGSVSCDMVYMLFSAGSAVCPIGPPLISLLSMACLMGSPPIISYAFNGTAYGLSHERLVSMLLRMAFIQFTIVFLAFPLGSKVASYRSYGISSCFMAFPTFFPWFRRCFPWLIKINLLFCWTKTSFSPTHNSPFPDPGYDLKNRSISERSKK